MYNSSDFDLGRLTLGGFVRTYLLRGEVGILTNAGANSILDGLQVLHGFALPKRRSRKLGALPNEIVRIARVALKYYWIRIGPVDTERRIVPAHAPLILRIEKF